MTTFHAPTGKLISGHVLDCARVPLERALREYDPQLYLKWNPRKMRGWGSWELRRRSELKQVVDLIEYEGGTYVKLDWHENNFVNHVKDFAYLNYEILQWVKQHDLWNKGMQRHNVAAQAERNLDYYEAEQQRKYREDLNYNLRQNRSAWRDLREYILKKGNSPAAIAAVWDKATNK